MTEPVDASDPGMDEGPWWQWHLGDRMVRHQHPDETDLGCRWPDCAWHGYRPGDLVFEELARSVPPPSPALEHLWRLGA